MMYVCMYIVAMYACGNVASKLFSAVFSYNNMKYIIHNTSRMYVWSYYTVCIVLLSTYSLPLILFS